MEKKKPKRFIMEIDIELHKDIKIRAANRNISMSLWVQRAVLAAIKREDQYEKTSKV